MRECERGTESDSEGRRYIEIDRERKREMAREREGEGEGERGGREGDTWIEK